MGDTETNDRATSERYEVSEAPVSNRETRIRRARSCFFSDMVILRLLL